MNVVTKPSLISIAQIQPVSEVNGPGRRTVIWVQGCHKRCPGCWNQEYLRFDNRWTISADALFDRVLKLTRDFTKIEGVTFSGGEPFDQAPNLLPLAERLKDAGLTLMAFSGYNRSELEEKPATSRLLEQLDLLVDGEYRRELAVNKLWRSSSNQTVHFLSPRYESWRNKVESETATMEVTLDGSSVRITGFPNPGILNALKARPDKS